MTQKPPSIVIPEAPDTADRKVIYDGLVAFETEAAGSPDVRPLAVLIKDEAGTTLGGLWGNTVYLWLVIELIFIPKEFRNLGLGTRIMAEAEAIARQRGCVGIWLDTYDFQAPDFYAALGFEVFGAVEGQPPGGSRIFMRKMLRP